MIPRKIVLNPTKKLMSNKTEVIPAGGTGMKLNFSTYEATVSKAKRFQSASATTRAGRDN